MKENIYKSNMAVDACFVTHISGNFNFIPPVCFPFECHIQDLVILGPYNVSYGLFF